MSFELDVRLGEVKTPEALWALRREIAAHYHEHGCIDHFGELLQAAFGRVFACPNCDGRASWKASHGIGSPANCDIENCPHCAGSGLRDAA